MQADSDKDHESLDRNISCSSSDDNVKRMSSYDMLLVPLSASTIDAVKRRRNLPKPSIVEDPNIKFRIVYDSSSKKYEQEDTTFALFLIWFVMALTFIVLSLIWESKPMY